MLIALKVSKLFNFLARVGETPRTPPFLIELIKSIFSSSVTQHYWICELYFVVKARFSVDCILLHKVEVIMQASSSLVPLFFNLDRESVLLLKSRAGLWQHFLPWTS